MGIFFCADSYLNENDNEQQQVWPHKSKELSLMSLICRCGSAPSINLSLMYLFRFCPFHGLDDLEKYYHTFSQYATQFKRILQV